MQLPAPITSRANARVKALRAGFSGQACEPGDLLGLEGEHLITEAMAAGVALDTVFVRAGSESRLGAWVETGLETGLGRACDARQIVVLAREVFASAVDTPSPQGVAALVPIPVIRPPALGGLVLVLESLQDPGNLGTLLRSAEAFGVTRVYVTPETVSAWNPKVVRASAGSVFRMPVTRLPVDRIAGDLRGAGIALLAAVVGAEAVAAPLAALEAPCALMIGNEGAGLSRQALMLADGAIHIPCRIESLNAAVAGSILLYEAARRGFAGGVA